MNTNVLIVGAHNGNIGTYAAAACGTFGWKVETLDFRDSESFDITKATDRARIDWESYQHVVFCQGVVSVAIMSEQSDLRVQHVVDVNLTGTMLAVRQFLDSPSSHNWPRRVVVVGSHSAEWPSRLIAPYCAAKAGLNQFVKCMAREYHPKGFRFFCVNPGHVEGTKLQVDLQRGAAKHFGMSDLEFAEQQNKRMIMDRWQTPRDVGQFIGKLVDGQLDWLAGTSINYTGGPQ